jgi:type I restriction enzyme, R subunit
MTSHFAFLATEWPDLLAEAKRAEDLALTDPRTACFYARRTLELAVAWAYHNDPDLKQPYDTSLSALIHAREFREAAGDAVFAKARYIKDLGNLAVHSAKKIGPMDGVGAVRELFHVSYWLARTYGRKDRPAPGLTFNPHALPTTSPIPAQTIAQLQTMAAKLAEQDGRLAEAEKGRASLDAELAQLRAELAEAKKLNKAKPDTHDYSEAATRDAFIDLLLKEAGWPLDKPQDREFQVAGMPNNKGEGFVDYVLWGDDGKPLGLVEAKRTKRDPLEGERQAELYANCLEKQFGQRPIIFLSNGYDHWIWDDKRYPRRPIQGFLKKPELELMIQRRTTQQSLASTSINEAIVERPYQHRAIRRIGEAFEKDNDRKALVVMATGAGKTRTVIALADQLMRAGWAKRTLFLADRVALVNQAVKAFKSHLPTSAPVNLVTEKNTEGRVYVSTYPTMMGLIEQVSDGQRRFGPGHFDLIVIDEAHRSVYQKYRAIFDYFDSLLVGLTATPKDEIDRNTYGLFDLETGIPTDAYGLEDAVRDGHLVPPRAVSVPLKFQREGIKYADLSEDEKDQWDTLEWNEDGEVPEEVGAEAVNKWLFNENTVDQVLAHVMENGLKVAGGDRLGKTIVFAKNHDHAVFIQKRFDLAYPHYAGSFARVIDFKTEYAQSLIDDFSNTDKAPHIAISVDMLDTGIDVPDVVNLVFFKIVRSKTKFWQMIGRGTRLRPHLFGPGEHKQFFYVFDYCQNLEFFNQNPDAAEAKVAPSLGKRLFTTRLDLLGELDKRPPNETEKALRADTAARLRDEVAGMNLDNFIVRPKRRYVERYAPEAAWASLSAEQRHEISEYVAGLPTSLVDDDEDAKRFDMLMIRLQLAVLRSDKSFARLRDEVIKLASALEEQSNIPMVQEQLPLIQEVQSDLYWQDVAAPMLEIVRRRLRALMRLIEKAERTRLYTNFADEMGEAVEVGLPGLGAEVDYERFKAKVRHFLRQHQDHIAIHKLRRNQPLTSTDLTELERILAESGPEACVHMPKAKELGLGLFVRSLVGMERDAAKGAFASFLAGKSLTANQIEFIDLIINHLTENGALEPERLYESPFTDKHPLGIDGLFPAASDVDQLIATLDDLRRTAVA